MCVNLDSFFILNPNVVNYNLGSKDARGMEVMPQSRRYLHSQKRVVINDMTLDSISEIDVEVSLT